MKTYLYEEENYTLSAWSGGQTKELAIYPRGQKYIDREFIWRLSSATVETDESDFTRLPDYDRVLMVLDGEVVLEYNGERVAKLKTLEQDSFDGAWKTKSYGKVTDFNLMVRKGNEGYLDLLRPQSEKQMCGSTCESALPLCAHALYCKEGYLLVSIGEKTQMVQPGQLFVIEYEMGETAKYSIMGEGVTVRAQIFYSGMEEELFPVEIPREKATFDDFKACVFLANTQFRGARYLCKSLQRTWYDEALSSVIRKLERYFVTSLVFFAGLVAILSLSLAEHMTALPVLTLFFGWVLVDCLLISPLIFFAFVPKPVRKHIKDIDKLTPYEQKVRAREQGQNEQLEKLLKKYKNSGKYLGRED